MQRSLLAAAAALLLPTFVLGSGFHWKDTEGKYADLLLDETKVARYVYEAIDESTPERRLETYKPFVHVYDKAGEEFITKGPGGRYTHHRGIYYGFSRVSGTDAEGAGFKVDTWHCKGGHEVHREFRTLEGDANKATLCVLIDWVSDSGGVFATEEREMVFTRDGNALVVQFRSTLSTGLETPVKLDGDPQHAGFQFRASNELAEKTAKQTYYIRPGSGVGEPGKTINWGKAEHDKDPALTNLPWKGMSFVVGGERYTTLYVDNEGNPKPARYSERDYGRFGSYFVAEVTKAKPLTVHYALRIQPGEMTPEDCASKAKALAK